MDRSTAFEKALSAEDALVLAVPEAGFGNERARVTIENLAKVGWKLAPFGNQAIEDCAKICDGLRSENADSSWNDALKEAAYDIRALAERKPRFAQTSCSQCGRDFGPGDHGYSHCGSHKGLESR